MASTKSTQVGSLTILLDFDPYQVQGARLTIPLLGIDEHIPQFMQYESLPAGLYPGTITASLTSGEELVENVRVKILPKQGNLHEFKIAGPPQEVVIRPVDSENRVILFSEIKIENVDLNFRPVRDEKGVICRVRPGEYQVQVILPNLQIKTLPVRITSDSQIYTLTIHDKYDESRRDPRIQLSVPADYRTHEGIWVSTQTINISTTGLCLIKKQWSMDDENLYVRLFVPMPSAPIECPARVRWVKDEGKADSRMGLEIHLDKSMKSALSKWLQQNGKKPIK